MFRDLRRIFSLFFYCIVFLVYILCILYLLKSVVTLYSVCSLRSGYEHIYLPRVQSTCTLYFILCALVAFTVSLRDIDLSVRILIKQLYQSTSSVRRDFLYIMSASELLVLWRGRGPVLFLRLVLLVPCWSFSDVYKQ